MSDVSTTGTDAVYTASRAAFDASLSGLITDPWGALQDRLYRWQVNTYGVPQPALLCLGVVEEAGELADSFEHADEADAIADVTIFAIQLATCYRLDAGALIDAAFPTDEVDWCGTLGKLSHAVLKSEQGIRGLGDKEAARKAVARQLLDIFSLCLDWAAGSGTMDYREEYAHLVDVIAGQVMARKKSELPQVVR